jgi:hypothetical protein
MATVTVGTNSWVTITEADDYLDGKFGADAWASLSNTIKTQCLISAYRWIFNYPFFNIPASSTSEAVKSAQIELAWWIYQYYTAYEQRGALIAGGVTDFTLSKWEEKLSEQDMPQVILNFLDDELEGKGGYFPTVSRELSNNQSG